MGLLTAKSGHRSRSTNRSHDEIGAQKRLYDSHDRRMQDHVDEHLALGEQVPDPSLQLGVLVVLVEVRAGERVIGRLAQDDVPRRLDLGFAEQPWQADGATAVQQLRHDL